VGVRAGDTGGGRFVIASRDTPAVRVGKANGELRVEGLVRTVRLRRRTRCDPDEEDRQGRDRQPASHPLWRTVIGSYHCKSCLVTSTSAIQYRSVPAAGARLSTKR